MATSYTFKPIITSGILMNLDCMNLKSYSGSGTSIYDLTNSQNNGILTNSPSIDTKGIILDGINDYVDTSFVPTIGTGSISYDVWFKTSTAQTGGIINVRTATAVQLVVALSDSVGGFGSNLLGYCYDGTTQRFSPTTETWVDNIWHHVVFTHNSTDDKLYVDGVLRGSSTSTAVNISNTAALRVGALGDGVSIYAGWYFNGSISNAKVYNRVLTPEEVSQNYNALKNRFI